MLPLSWLLERSLRTQARRLSAAAHSGSTRVRRPSQGTHNCCNVVRLPRLSGMVPLSWLEPRLLRTQARRLSAAAESGSTRPSTVAGHAQIRQRSQAAQAGRDAPVELVVGEGAADTSATPQRCWRVGRHASVDRSRNAQSLQRSQVAQAGRDGAAELVGVEGAADTSAAPQRCWRVGQHASVDRHRARTELSTQSGCPGWTGWCR